VYRALRATTVGEVGATGPAAGGATEAFVGLGTGAAGTEITIGRLAQPPSITPIASAIIQTEGARARPRLNLSAMWVIYLEAFAVAALMVFFVWWTMRGKK